MHSSLVRAERRPRFPIAEDLTPARLSRKHVDGSTIPYN